jgi:hypothetical protein
MKINKNYENQLLCGSVLEKQENEASNREYFVCFA